MDVKQLERLIETLRESNADSREMARRIQESLYEDIGYAKVDHARAARQGFPEVVFGKGKPRQQIVGIVERLLERSQSNLLVTHTDAETFGDIRNIATEAEWHDSARLIRIMRDSSDLGTANIAVVTAGTSDIPVAEEAVVTAEMMGNDVEHLYDVGVAGIHRLLANRASLTRARVVIVCAGMEGALPSVVGGLVGVPVIAVPTSVGYGAAFHGLAALLGMMNSCASNVSVVNIDNGFGAGYVAALINRL